MSPKKASNPRKIFKVIAEYRKLGKWEIKEKVDLPYPRVHEAVKSLILSNYIKIVEIKHSKKNVPMKIFSLTFKGVLNYLVTIGVERPKTFSNPGETTENFKKRVMDERTEYVNNINNLIPILEYYGKKLNYPIFQQIKWLFEKYGIIISDIILDITRNQLTQPIYVIKAAKKNQNQEKKELLKRIKLFKKIPSLRTTILFHDDGKERKETEIDNLIETKNRLSQLKREMSLTEISENKILKNNFAVHFFERISYLKAKNESKNKTLLNYAQDLLEKRRMSMIKPLENIIVDFGG